MKSMEYKFNELSKYGDLEILKEAASRLSSNFKKKSGIDFNFGHFKLVFHEGVFQCVEEWYRNKTLRMAPSPRGKQ